MIKNYFKTAFRNFKANKTYSMLNIFGLAIGIACAGLIFLWVEDEITFDNVNLKKDRIAEVKVNLKFSDNLFTMGSTPRPLAATLKNEIPGIVNAARVSDRSQRSLFSFNDKSLYAAGLYADPALFSMFTLNFVKGNAEQVFQEKYSILLTETAVKKFFGNETDVLGRTLKLDNQQNFLITGVIKDLPQNSTLQFEWLAPYEASPYYETSQTWDGYGPYTYVELGKEADIASINKNIKQLIQKKKPGEQSEIFLFPMKDWRLYDEFANGKQTGSGLIKQVWLLSAIAWILLVIACINFMNLATANSMKRAKEVGVRKVLGVHRKGLVAQFMCEAFFMSVLATISAVLIIALALPAFNALMEKQLVLHITNPIHIAALLVITIVCGFIAGSYPSLYLSSFNPIKVLKGLKFTTGSAPLIRKGLVVVQFTVSIVFIISTIVVYLQIQHVKNRELGFNKNNLVEIDMRHNFSNEFLVIQQDLLHTGVVENMASSDHVTIYGGNSDDRFKWRGKPENNEVGICFRNVSAAFIATSGMKIIEGRDFTTDTAYESRNVIITASMAKMMGNESAIGKVIQSPRGNPKGVFTDVTVIGVVQDYVFGNMYGQSSPVIFFCKPPKDDKLLYVRLKPQARADEAIAKIHAVMKKNNPVYPLEYKFVDEQFNKMFSSEMKVSTISAIFAGLTITICCMGLLGLAAYTAERRTKEIGIRKVLGASVSGVTALLSKDFLQLVVIACVLAFPIAWWMMHSWLQSYNYHISISWWIFLLAGAIALLIAFATVSYQAIKAAVANPVKSLRME